MANPLETTFDPLLAKPGEKSPFGHYLAKAQRETRLLPFPGPLGANGLKFRMRSPLTEVEMDAAILAAQDYMIEKLKQDALRLTLDNERYEAERERQILSRALRCENNPDAPFSSVEDLRFGLNNDTRKALMQAYDDMAVELSPNLKPQNLDQVKELVAVLGKEQASLHFLSYYERDTLVRIVIEQAEVLTRLQTPSFSNTGFSK